MKIRYRDILVNLNPLRFNHPQNDLILFLHGFSGSSNDWEGIADFIDSNFNLAAIDLIGHGETDSPADLSYYDINFIAELIEAAIQFFRKDKVILCGYSMGGRAALSFAHLNSQFIKSLILESTSAGISNDRERKLRINQDKELANFILQHSIEEFVDYWMNLELFKSQKTLGEKIIKKIRSEKMKNDKVGLANLLIGFGTGVMSPLYDRLPHINLKTLLITGKLDIKFTEINKMINSLLPDSRHTIIPSAGHNTHLENPIEFCKSINSFLLEQ